MTLTHYGEMYRSTSICCTLLTKILLYSSLQVTRVGSHDFVNEKSTSFNKDYYILDFHTNASIKSLYPSSRYGRVS